jgi:hypothetical protein
LLRLPISCFRQGYSMGPIGLLAMTSDMIMCTVIASPTKEGAAIPDSHLPNYVPSLRARRRRVQQSHAPTGWIFIELVLCSIRLLRLPISCFRQGYSMGPIGLLAMTSNLIMYTSLRARQRRARQSPTPIYQTMDRHCEPDKGGRGNPRLPFTKLWTVIASPTKEGAAIPCTHRMDIY